MQVQCMKQGTQSLCSGTAWRGREVGVGIRIWGTHICLWPIHVDVWQKQSQYCNYPPIKINLLTNLSFEVKSYWLNLKWAIGSLYSISFQTCKHIYTIWPKSLMERLGRLSLLSEWVSLSLLDSSKLKYLCSHTHS